MDKYFKLRPEEKTPDSEICKCIGRPPIVLQGSVTCNPIVCADCNLEIEVNQLNFDIKTIEEIANWRNFHYCFFNLWLDSGEFETWAKEKLTLSESPVNRRALALLEKIRISYDCFYWWFVDNSEDDFQPILDCPNCGKELIIRVNKFNTDTRVCNHCHIIVA